MDEQKQKVCIKCGLVKPLTEFYAHKHMADGYLNKCKMCFKVDVRINYRKNRDHYQEYEKSRRLSAKRKARAVENCKSFRMLNPEKAYAHNVVNEAKRYGKLKKMPCEICGSKNVVAHHDDYAKPLDVIWLCHRHHSWIHQ
jgi:ribosomal protein S27AE